MGDVSHRKISYPELLIFQVFNCIIEKFVQNFCIFSPWEMILFPSTNNISDNNGFKFLQNCLLSRAFLPFRLVFFFPKDTRIGFAFIIGSFIGAKSVFLNLVLQMISFQMCFQDFYSWRTCYFIGQAFLAGSKPIQNINTYSETLFKVTFRRTDIFHRLFK